MTKEFWIKVLKLVSYVVTAVIGWLSNSLI